MEEVIQVQELRKAYGSVVAVDGISFTAREGEIFGMVGPNGAGKTTAIECLEGLRRPDVGRVRVLGLDPWSGRLALAERIGVQLQESALPPRLRVAEARQAGVLKTDNGESLFDGPVYFSPDLPVPYLVDLVRALRARPGYTVQVNRADLFEQRMAE